MAKPRELSKEEMLDLGNKIEKWKILKNGLVKKVKDSENFTRTHEYTGVYKGHSVHVIQTEHVEERRFKSLGDYRNTKPADYFVEVKKKRPIFSDILLGSVEYKNLPQWEMHRRHDLCMFVEKIEEKIKYNKKLKHLAKARSL